MSIVRPRHAIAAVLFTALASCSSVGPRHTDVVLSSSFTNAVSYWDDIGAATVIATVQTAVTPEELRPSFAADLATMHLAMYDAVSAIDGRYKPYLYKPASRATGASMDAAVSAAAYGVLRALYPNRGAHYQAAYDSYVAKIADGDAKSRGLAIGAEAAAALVAKRAKDGRSVALAAYAPGTKPGNYRGPNPINRHFPSIRPFALTSYAQFRPAPPPALTSAEYAADLNEIKALGGTVSTARTPAQLETARFHSEAPTPYFTRNFGRFARSTPDVSDAARLMAVIYTGYADAIAACMDAKYFYQAWRPLSAIPLADTDDNPATIADAAWTPVLTTPSHPEYPAAHSCTAASLGESLRQYYGTDKVTYSFDSKVTGTTRTYTTTDQLTEESRVARIYGGMHFRYATTAGAQLGKQVSGWTMQQHFRRND